jgi:hypothetical protein
MTVEPGNKKIKFTSDRTGACAELLCPLEFTPVQFSNDLNGDISHVNVMGENGRVVNVYVGGDFTGIDTSTIDTIVGDLTDMERVACAEDVEIIGTDPDTGIGAPPDPPTTTGIGFLECCRIADSKIVKIQAVTMSDNTVVYTDLDSGSVITAAQLSSDYESDQFVDECTVCLVDVDGDNLTTYYREVKTRKDGTTQESLFTEDPITKIRTPYTVTGVETLPEEVGRAQHGLSGFIKLESGSAFSPVGDCSYTVVTSGTRGAEFTFSNGATFRDSNGRVEPLPDGISITYTWDGIDSDGAPVVTAGDQPVYIISAEKG